MKRLKRILGRLSPGCAFGAHRLTIPTGIDCWEPIYCARCGIEVHP